MKECRFLSSLKRKRSVSNECVEWSGCSLFMSLFKSFTSMNGGYTCGDTPYNNPYNNDS